MRKNSRTEKKLKLFQKKLKEKPKKLNFRQRDLLLYAGKPPKKKPDLKVVKNWQFLWENWLLHFSIWAKAQIFGEGSSNFLEGVLFFSRGVPDFEKQGGGLPLFLWENWLFHFSIWAKAQFFGGGPPIF